MKGGEPLDKQILGIGMISALAVSFIAVLLISTNVFGPIAEKQVQEMKAKEWIPVPLADAVDGDGNTGFITGYIYPHEADPGTAYASNLSTGTAYEYSNDLNTSMTGETPYDTTFDIVIKMQVSSADGYNSTGTTWEDSWIRCYLNCSTLSISASEMTEVSIADDGSTQRWVHYYLNNGGSGYTISRGTTFQMDMNFEAYT